MNKLIEYVFEVFGVEIKSELLIAQFTNEVSEIENIESFIKYLADNFNHVDIQYLTKVQKLFHLITEYKRSEARVRLSAQIEASNKWAVHLCDKVKSISSHVLNAGVELKCEHIRNNETKQPYFDEKEVKALDCIGSLTKCVKMQRSVTARDMLLDELCKIIERRLTTTAKQLPKNDVLMLANNLVKRMRDDYK